MSLRKGNIDYVVVSMMKHNDEDLECWYDHVSLSCMKKVEDVKTRQTVSKHV